MCLLADDLSLKYLSQSAYPVGKRLDHQVPLFEMHGHRKRRLGTMEEESI